MPHPNVYPNVLYLHFCILVHTLDVGILTNSVILSWDVSDIFLYQSTVIFDVIVWLYLAADRINEYKLWLVGKTLIMYKNPISK